MNMLCLRSRSRVSAHLCPRTLAITLLALMFALAGCQSSDAPDDALRLYVGTWTSGEGGGHGVYRHDFDPSTGAFSTSGQVTEAANPSYLALSPDGQYLYSVNQTVDASSVSAFRVDDATGALTLLNTVDAGSCRATSASTRRDGGCWWPPT